MVPINYKLHPREMVQILDDAGVSQVFASPAIAAELATVTAVPIETLETRDYSQRRAAPPPVVAVHRFIGVGLAVLYQRNNRAARKAQCSRTAT